MQNKKSNYIMPTYGDRNIEFETGKGCYLYTKNGEKYLDFGAGIAVNSLGHCHPKLVDVLTKLIDAIPKYIFVGGGGPHPNQAGNPGELLHKQLKLQLKQILSKNHTLD